MVRSLPLLLCALLFVAGNPVLAQVTNPRSVESIGASYHFFAQPGEPTIQVLVLGDASTGMYVIGSNTSMMELLALTGSGRAAQGESAQIKRDVTIRLMREQGGQRNIVYEEAFETFLSEPASNPALQDGDIFTVEIDQERKMGILDALAIASRLASVTLLAIRVIDLF